MFGASQKCFRRMESSILFMGKAFPDPHGKWTRFLNFQISSFLSKLGILIRYYFLSHGKGTRFVSDRPTHVAPSLIKISFRKNIFFLPPPPLHPTPIVGHYQLKMREIMNAIALLALEVYFLL